MQYGFGAPNRGADAAPEALAPLVRGGEKLGFRYVAASDHIIIPRDIRSRYPYSESGTFGGTGVGGTGECLEQLTHLSYIAGLTTSLRLLTAVMVLPHRSPVQTAKMLASIDVLSGGRLILGCGVGWMKEEFEALGAPPYEERGAVGSEYIRAFKELWTSDKPAFDGRYVRFSDVFFEPKPVQKPHPPIWIGGESPYAIRRAALLGDGWYPSFRNPTYPVRTPGELSASLERLRRYAEDAGRDAGQIDVGFAVMWQHEPRPRAAPSGERPLFTGAPEQVAEDIRAFERAGVTHLTVTVQGETAEDKLEQMERFMREVAPLAA